MEATMSNFFPGFEQRQIETSGAKINLVTGGSGPALLLLHGYPQTHVMWRKVAPRLAQDFTVVVPDLRGYGDSSKPPAGENFTN
jgi:haloacetate dehalogenase